MRFDSATYASESKDALLSSSLAAFVTIAAKSSVSTISKTALITSSRRDGVGPTEEVEANIVLPLELPMYGGRNEEVADELRKDCWYSLRAIGEALTLQCPDCGKSIMVVR